MAEECIAGRDGVNVQGYRDYRGVLVFGAWLWNTTLGFGMATEINVDEALEPYYRTRQIVLFTLGITVLSALFL